MSGHDDGGCSHSRWEHKGAQTLRLTSIHHHHLHLHLPSSPSSPSPVPQLALSPMAYNREWDKGKQIDYGAWQPAPRGNGHTRDDEWFGGDNSGNPKRRKFNDGVSPLDLGVPLHKG